jgi:hypothetical protein
MDDVSEAYVHFDPGVIYSHNTLQNFIDFFMQIAHNNYLTQIPFIVTQATTEQHNSDIDQLSDLDGGRQFLLDKFAKFLDRTRVQMSIAPNDHYSCGLRSVLA